MLASTVFLICLVFAEPSCAFKQSTGFHFLKEFSLMTTEGKEFSEVSYVMTKGTTYMLQVCGESKIELFDSQRHKIATSDGLAGSGGVIGFGCQSTGIFYIRVTSKEPSKCFLSFSK